MSEFGGTTDWTPFTFDAMAAIVLTLAVLALCVLGISGNAVILVVWSAESSFKPTTFLMKCLAVTDLLLLVNTIITILFSRSVAREEFLNNMLITSIPSGQFRRVMYLFNTILKLYFASLSVHATLAVAVTRWIAVYKPLSIGFLLSKGRVRVGYSLVVVWCFCPMVPLLSFRVSYSEIALAHQVVWLALPILLLVALSGSLLWKVRRTQRTSRNLGQQNNTARASRHQRLLAAVLCVCITTALTYPVGVVMRIYSLSPSSSSAHFQVKHYLLATFWCLEVFNSSINVVYYLAFASNFRKLYRRRCCCCLENRERRQPERLGMERPGNT